jgi:hypothetical protein
VSGVASVRIMQNQRTAGSNSYDRLGMPAFHNTTGGRENVRPTHRPPSTRRIGVRAARGKNHNGRWRIVSRRPIGRCRCGANRHARGSARVWATAPAVVVGSSFWTTVRRGATWATHRGTAVRTAHRRATHRAAIGSAAICAMNRAPSECLRRDRYGQSCAQAEKYRTHHRTAPLCPDAAGLLVGTRPVDTAPSGGWKTNSESAGWMEKFQSNISAMKLG